MGSRLIRIANAMAQRVQMTRKNRMLGAGMEGQRCGLDADRSGAPKEHQPPGGKLWLGHS